jgi:Gpi18-like mannosyltransferase
MRFKIEKLLIFALAVRLLTLILPWLTINLFFPQNQPVSLIQFTQTAWSRWDASHYLYLAEHWYTSFGDEANFIVFFPLYPLVLKPIIFILGNVAVSGIATSIVLFLAGIYYFYKLVAIDYSEKVATYAVVALIIFPTSYFFNTPYTESLFFLIFNITMYAARKEKWILSGIFSGLATVTRPFGFLILPAILIEWLMNKKRNWRELPIITIPTIFAGLSYLYLNNVVFGNPFEFQKILATHWQKHLMSPIASIIDSWRIALSGGLTNYVVMVGWAESVTITLSWILIPFAFKYLRKSWAIFYTLSILLFSSTSFILSTPRYLLSIPPFFVLIALAERNYLFKIIWRVTSVALLFSLAILFARGQWAF